jgi:hypothetical protein
VSIISPTPGDTVKEGDFLTITVEATDEVAVASVDFLAGGEVVSTDFAAPYQFNFTVPVGVTGLTLGATAVDFGNNVGVAGDVVINVIPDPLPTVSITSPQEGDTVIEESTITIRADASDNVQVVGVDFFVDGMLEATDTFAPFSTPFVVPVGVSFLIIEATATDNLGNSATDSIIVNVTPDPLTTVIGSIVDSDGNPVEGATVTCLGVSGVTGFDGSFSITGIPTISGDVICPATFTTPEGKTFTGTSAAVPSVLGGITDVVGGRRGSGLNT